MVQLYNDNKIINQIKQIQTFVIIKLSKIRPQSDASVIPLSSKNEQIFIPNSL